MLVLLSLSLMAFPLVHNQSSASTPQSYGSGPLGSTDYPWTMFRNNALRTGVTAASGPMTGSLMWSLPTTTLTSSSPAIVDGTVFIASYDGNVYAIDEYAGVQKWLFSTGQFILASPAVSNGLVYITTACPTSGGQPFSCTGGSVYALDEATGSVVWQKLEPVPISSSPLVADGRVFYGIIALGNGRVLARFAMSGNLNWTAYLSDAVEVPPSVDNGRVFVGQIDGAIVALNETNGAQLWRVVPSGAVTFQTAPAVGYGMVFTGSISRGLVALNENTGATVWTFATGGSNTTSVALSGGRVYFGTGRGIVYSLNATTGVLMWSRTTGGAVASSPALALGSKTLFVGSNDHYLYALNVTTGAVLWRYLTGSSVASSPAVADGRVFFGSRDNTVYALGAIAPKLRASIASNSTSLRPGMLSVLTVTVTNGTVLESGANLAFASSVAGGGFTQPVMISQGVYTSNFTAPLVSSTVGTTIQVTASLPGYVSGSAQTTITLNPFPALTVAVSPRPPTVSPGGDILLEIKVSNGSQLIPGATILLSSSAGGSFSALTDGGNGNYTAVFGSPLQSSNPTITVQALKPGFSSGQGQTTVTINGVPDFTTLKLSGIPFWLLLAGGFLIFLLIVIGLARRREPPRHDYVPPSVPSYVLGKHVFREGLSRRFPGSGLMGLAAIAGS